MKTCRRDRVKRLNAAALETSFRNCYSSLVRYVIQLGGDASSAKDIVQEAFLRIWERRNIVDTGYSISALLYLTVRNLTLNQKRNVARRGLILKSFADTDYPTSPDEVIHAQMIGRQMRIWIQQLPDRRREAFELSRFDNLAYREIATIMGISINTVENHIHLAIEELRRKLREHEPDAL